MPSIFGFPRVFDLNMRTKSRTRQVEATSLDRPDFVAHPLGEPRRVHLRQLQVPNLGSQVLVARDSAGRVSARTTGLLSFFLLSLTWAVLRSPAKSLTFSGLNGNVVCGIVLDQISDDGRESSVNPCLTFGHQESPKKVHPRSRYGRQTSPIC